MPKFKYVGDPNDNFSGPDTINQYGQTWKKGEAVDIELDEEDEADQETLRRLEGNSHFVDLSDKDEVAAMNERQKAIEKREADAAKEAEAQRKRDEAEEKVRQKSAAKSIGAPTAENVPRPPGKVTREPVNDAFGGRTVEQRTQAEDHTKAGKTKS